MKWLDKFRGSGNTGSGQNLSLKENPAIPKLSPRETEVFLRLMAGAKMREIAEELGIKTSTVNGYCTQIYKRLDVHSKALLILRYSRYLK